MPGGVVVANPSSNPETVHAAAALGRAGLLERYHVPIATTPEQERTLRRVLPARLADPILTELRRRAGGAGGVPRGEAPAPARSGVHPSGVAAVSAASSGA
jgi:hypothetical protein